MVTTAVPEHREIDSLVPALYRDHARGLLGYAERRTSDHADAEDVAAAVWLEVWRQRELIAAINPACRRAWLYGTAHNVLRNLWRARAREERRSLAPFHTPFVPDVADHVDLTFDARALAGKIAAAAEGLSQEDRAILRLCQDEVPIASVSSQLGIGAAAARQRLCRARRRLRRIIEVTVVVVTALEALGGFADALSPVLS